MQSFFGQRILVTGATGFVGRHVCDFFERRGAEVVRTSRATSTGPNAFQVAALGADTDWSHALKDCTALVHLAARVHVIKEDATDPLHAFRLANTVGTLRLAEQAVQCGVKRMVFVSSIKVNGELGNFTAQSTPQPTDPYAISKFEAEQQLLAFGARHGLEVVVLRPPLVYGPGVRANFLKLFSLVAKGVPLPFALVKNQRSLVYVGNLASAIGACVMHPKAAGEKFLVSDGVDVSTAQLIREMALALGCKPRLLAVQPAILEWGAALLGKRATAQRLLGNLTASAQTLQDTLDWQVPYTLQQGMKKTARWYTQQHGKGTT